MYLQQMLKQSRVTLKKDTLPHMHTLLHKLHSASEQKKQSGGVLFSRSLLCLSVRRDDREGGQEEKEGERLRERERVKAGGG